MILIHPPVVKPSEPPAGLAALSGALAAFGVRHTLVDANLEAMLWLLEEAPRGDPRDTWTRRALLHLPAHLDLLRDWRGYTNTSRYRRAVADVNRLVQRTAPAGTHVSLADYGDDHLSPIRSDDLLQAASHPEKNVFYPYFSARFPALLEGAENDEVIGLSLNYLSQAICAFAMIGFLRLRYPASRIVLGGSLVTSWMGGAARKNPFSGLVDDLVAGPGEAALLSLSGINAAVGPTCPSFGGFNLEGYLAPGPILPYAASRGCYWRRCSFCPEKAEARPASFRPPREVIADLQALSARHAPALIHLTDNAVSPALMAAVAASRLDTAWYGFARITSELADPDFCRQLRCSGCVMLKLGLESGDQDVLDSLGKGLDVKTARRALAALREAGIATYVYLLFGTPDEDIACARKTLDFIAHEAASIDFLNLAIFNLPRNAPEAKSLDLRTFYEGDLSLYTDFVHPRDFERRKVRAFLDREFRAHPAVRPILCRQPPFFTSNHAALFTLARTL
ncbi:MAG: radical SAM protein [Syntrophorhabdales bacterium]